MKLRYHLNSLLAFICIVAMGAATIATFPQNIDPLRQLEARARAIPALHTSNSVPVDDRYQEQLIRTETVVQFVLGVHIIYMDIDEAEGILGFTMLDTKQPRAVVVDSKLHATARLEVLAHEAGHRLQPPVWDSNTSESEVFAQAVSYLVCLSYGHDTLDSSAAYLAVHKGGLHVLTDYKLDIEYAVMVLSGGTRAK